MTEQYAALLDAWKQASQAAKEAERRMNRRVGAFLAGTEPEPTEAERADVIRLHEQERNAFAAVLTYVRQTAKEGSR